MQVFYFILFYFIIIGRNTYTDGQITNRNRSQGQYDTKSNMKGQNINF